jgi:hypothetical protein
MLLLSTVFSAAAAVGAGSFGIAPPEVPLAFFVGSVGLRGLLGVRYPQVAQIFRVVLPFVLVTIWAVISSFVLPRVFAGQVYVWPQRSTTGRIERALLAASFGNVTQTLYLIANCTLLVASSIHSSQRTSPMRNVVSCFIWTGFAVAAVSAWQFLNTFSGVPFPTGFFHSNPGWAQLSDQTLGGVHRLNGPFAEPASLAGYMFGTVTATGWMLLKGHRGQALWPLFGSGLLIILLCTSTTGYVALGISGVGLGLYALLRASTVVLQRVFGFVLIASLGLALTAFTAVTFLPKLQPLATEIFTATLDKRQSFSYDQRSNEDMDSLATVFPTYGLGVGWGSNRSSSLLPGLVASLGVYGTVGLVWFAYGIVRMLHLCAERSKSLVDRRLIDCCVGYISGELLVNFISGPTIDNPEFFLILGLLIGTAARVTRRTTLLRHGSKARVVHTI